MKLRHYQIASNDPIPVQTKAKFINEQVKDCLPFDRSAGKFYIAHGELGGKLLEEKEMGELLQEGRVFECSLDEADGIWQTIATALLCAQMGLLSDEGRADIKKDLKQMAHQYCKSCHEIKKPEDVTRVKENAAGAMERMLGNYQARLYDPYRPEYILIKKA